MSSKETITLRWKMLDKAWSHWVQGLGKKPIRDVLLAELDQVRESPEAVKKIRERCEAVAQELNTQDTQSAEQPIHEIEIQLPSDDWREACQRVGLIDGDPVRTDHLLAALIFESKSWKQDGNAVDEFNAGWYQESLTSSLTATNARLSLGQQERIIAWTVAAAAAVGALAAVSNAVTAWLAL